MKQLLLMAGTIATLICGSCKKEKLKNNPDNGSGTARLLKKVTETQNGTTTVYNLNYDGNKRLTSLNSTDNLETTSFTYDASGNITKIETREHNFYSTYTYTYNNGIPVSGTIKTLIKVAGEPDDLVQDNVLTYTVVNNQVTNIHQQMNLVDAELNFHLTYHASGNLAKAEVDGDEVYSASFAYGTKKSAFPSISKYVMDLDFFLVFTAKNEVITSAYDYPGTQFDNAITNQYTYDASGYPLTSNGGDTQLKFEYQ